MRKGYSLVEVLLVMLLVGLVAGLAFGIYTNAPKVSERSTAVALCRAIDGAKQAFRNADPLADQKWAALDDGGRYARLRDPSGTGDMSVSYLPMSPASKDAYLPQGYSFKIGNLWEKCYVTGPDGHVSY